MICPCASMSIYRTVFSASSISACSLGLAVGLSLRKISIFFEVLFAAASFAIPPRPRSVPSSSLIMVWSWPSPLSLSLSLWRVLAVPKRERLKASCCWFPSVPFFFFFFFLKVDSFVLGLVKLGLYDSLCLRTLTHIFILAVLVRE